MSGDNIHNNIGDNINDQEQRARLSRRGFLTGAAGGLGAAGVAAVVLTQATRPASATTGAGRSEAGYRETEHVRRVYELARF
jgi:secreted PhoX family phosphatase